MEGETVTQEIESKNDERTTDDCALLLENESRQNTKTRLLDFLIGFVFITPVFVLFWSSTWLLQDLFTPSIFPRSPRLELVVSVGTSSFVILALMITQNRIQEYLEQRGRLFRVFIWGFLVYIIGVSAVVFWRGVWKAIDCVTGKSIFSALISHTLGFVILSVCNAACNITATPVYILKDNFEPVVKVELRVGEVNHWVPTKDITARAYLIINSIFTVIVVGICVVSFWRGTWILVETSGANLISPSLQTQRVCVFFVGSVIHALCFWSSRPLGDFIAQSTWSRNVKTVLELAYIYVQGIGVVSLWMGWWYVGDLLMTQVCSPPLMASLCHVISVILLFSGKFAINLLSTPAFCRMHTAHALEGFNLGSYFGIPVPPVIPKRADDDLTETSNLK
ncbi:predicted protein [Nematostella vectensis]|uniref:Uncharacterized protein n=1 Tax=Nematostella vectensis TaxID=45351 RepID=A7S2P6_NEMVE|nr:uncharacterized protein LOC5513919 [Nematostella vectensis]EDO42074.1 predicted protein [Nematostella vectensis]|eukprot:XP_001634137.1 predicted protein [Nematostella vectensis]